MKEQHSSLKDSMQNGKMPESLKVIAFRGGSNSGNGIEPHTKEALRRALLEKGLDIHIDLLATKDGRCVVLSQDDLAGVDPQRLTFRNLIKTRPETISLERFMRGMNASVHLFTRIPRIYFNAGAGIDVEGVIITAVNSEFPFSFSSPFREVLMRAKEVSKEERVSLEIGFWSRGNGSNPLRVAQSIGVDYVVISDKGAENDDALKRLVSKARGSGVEPFICDVGSDGRINQLVEAGVRNVIVDNLIAVKTAGN